MQNDNRERERESLTTNLETANELQILKFCWPKITLNCKANNCGF